MKPIAIALLTATLLAPSTTFSQTRNRSSRPRPAPKTSTPPVSQVRTTGATRVGEQIKLLTQFIYGLGKVTSGFTAADDSARRNEASPEIQKQTQESKARLRSYIQGFREGLDKLEIDFRNTPELQPFYIKLAGAAAGAATAEEQAAANQFDAAGRSLLNVINRLTDVLVVMRQ